MAENRPRIFQDSRDIFFSLFAIVIMMALTVGFTGMCSFSKDDAEHLPLQQVDGEQIMSMEARAMPFPVRLPATPEGWHLNTARRSMINKTPTPILGWLTADRGYVQLMQTDQQPQAIADDFDDHPRDPAATVDFAGQQFVEYPVEGKSDGGKNANVDQLWIADLGDVRVVLSGRASNEDFATLAEAFMHATPLPR